MTPTRSIPRRACRPVSRCPVHGDVLEGGDVQYRCPRGHRVQAADINREVTR